MASSDFKISISVDSYEEKTAAIATLQKSEHNFKTMKGIDPKFE